MIVSGISEAILLTLFLLFQNSIININKLYYSSDFEYIKSFFGINNPSQLKFLLGILFIFIYLLLHLLDY